MTGSGYRAPCAASRLQPMVSPMSKVRRNTIQNGHHSGGAATWRSCQGIYSNAGALPSPCDVQRFRWAMGCENLLFFRLPHFGRPPRCKTEKEQSRGAVIRALASAVEQNLHECRERWWIYQRNNPLIQTEGPCCLNNTPYGSWIVRSASYDPIARETRLISTSGQSMLLPMT
jgi:hypothetical protein